MEPKPLPEIILTKEMVNKRVKLYQKGKHKVLSARLSERAGKTVEDTKSVWYSKEQVATWLEEMNDLGGDGIRIYLGEIEELEAGKEQSPFNPIPGQLCLMMVLTKKGSFDDSHVNIEYESLTDYAIRKEKADALIANRANKQFNAGGYCPPICLTEGIDYPNDSLT
jgi:hypothetical protein